MKKQPSEGAHKRARALRREMTEAEKKIWQRLRSCQIGGYRFRRQVPIGRFIADFVCDEARLIIEIDGGQHDLASAQEASRTRFLENQGYRVLRFWNNEVLGNPDGVHEVIAEDLRRVVTPSPIKGEGSMSSGFTIIEILIVLVITAMISGILLFAFQRVLDIRIRLAAFLEGTDVPTLIAGWFRDSVDGLLPDVADGPDRFVGAARRFTGLSVAPIDGMPGVPTRITWELVFDADAGRTYLRYQSGADAPLNVASWPGDLGGILYCRADLSCADQWPPAAGKAAQLPALIRLDAVKGTQFWPILAAPQAARNPPPKLPNFARQ